MVIVEVVEVDSPRSEDPLISYTVGCTKCGEQGNHERFRDAQKAAEDHRREHIEFPNAP